MQTFNHVLALCFRSSSRKPTITFVDTNEESTNPSEINGMNLLTISCDPKCVNDMKHITLPGFVDIEVDITSVSGRRSIKVVAKSITNYIEAKLDVKEVKTKK